MSDEPSGAVYYGAYLYFFGKGKVRSYEYFHPVKPLGNLDDLIKQLIENAVRDKDNPPAYCYNVEHLHRRRPGYIFIASDQLKFSDIDHVKFRYKCSSYDPNDNDNHDREPIVYVRSSSITVDNQDISVSVYLNAVTSTSSGGQLGDKEWEDFDWHHPELKRLRGDGSGGTNMGPASLPPGESDSS